MTPYLKALSQFGIKEIVGKQDNPEVLKYFNDIGFDGEVLKDETAWCSAFANWCAFQTGHSMSGKLTARSWLSVGEEIFEGCQKQGDVVVFWRESPQSWKGHVAFLVAERNGWVYVIGGNQRNQVKISAYPKSRVLSYRRLETSAIK